MKFILLEPQRAISVLDIFIEISETYPRIAQFAPIGADIFVFIYPILLVVLYLRGIIKKQLNHKEGVLFIFLSCVISIITNICVQSFFLRNRPNMGLYLIEAEETFLHKFLPSSSFPSDHATVSMSIAIATLLRGYTIKNRHPERNEGKNLIRI
ncbi:MAG: hypothetical protein LBI53_04730 [Candidatus Peribacteria bacterium]|jgi:membrane-associated phospholipid phosphatase|nr:hypothetical protein [Candidatus Peribacteria bacterium]